jgi:ABC-type glycerol-3-phosphate transport system substrate-binding protein
MRRAGMKIKWYLTIIALILATLPLAACSGEVTTTTTTTGGLTQEGSQQIALDFLRDSATYKFDGMPETLELVDTLVMR